MCSLTLTETIQEQLESLGGNGTKLEELMKRRAWSANRDLPSSLDSPDTHLRAGFAEELRQQGVRKERIFGHRVYFFGNHTDCNYTAFFVKLSKKGDDEKQDDNNAKFHEKLKRALKEQVTKVFPDPQEQNKEKIPDWQQADWYKKYLNS